MGPLQLRELNTDWRAVTATVVVTLAMTGEHYDLFREALGYHPLERVLFYFLIPLLVIVLVYREAPGQYGLGLGDWRAGLALTLPSCAGLAAAMAFLGRSPAFRTYYDGGANVLGVAMPAEVALDLIGWEFTFRGFLLFALYPVCGPLAIVLQAVPFTIAHFGKPVVETLSCIFGGSALGYVAWRTRSFLYPFLIHWFLSAFTILVASGAAAL